MSLLRETNLVFQRQLSLLARNPVWLLIGIFQPVMYLLLFAPLLQKAIGVSDSADAYKLFVPGLLVLLALFGGLFQGFGLLTELRAGILERSRVTPVSRYALLLGRSLRDVCIMLFQAVVITVVAIPLGLRVSLGGILLAYLLLSLIVLMTSAASYAVALTVRSEAALAPLMNTVSQPVLLLSGILLPLTLAPAWLRGLSDANPFSWSVSGIRALFADDLGDSVIWKSIAIVGALTLLSMTWAARAFARSLR